MPINAFQSQPTYKIHQQHAEETKGSTDDQETKMNETEENDDNIDPYAIFKQQYEIAIASAENGKYPESLRAFDLTIRFWGNHLEKLKEAHPAQYKAFNFPDVNGCDASKHFLNLYKTKKQNQNTKIKKKLWKPPPKHQPKKNHDDDDEEIIYFDDEDSHLDTNDDVDLIEDEIPEMDDVKEWEKRVQNHRKSGSEMFEYHAQVLMEMDRDFEAIKACQSAILLNNMSEINWLTLSRAELNFGDPFQALLSISRAIELDYANDEVIEHYSNVYAICNKLSEMKKIGKMTDDVLKRRLVPITGSNIKQQSKCKEHIDAIEKRMHKRQDTKDHVGRIHKQTDAQQIVSDYRDMLKKTQKLKIKQEK